MTKHKLQVYIALGMFFLWAIGLAVAVFDGDAMVKVMTPLMTLMIGWLFADKAAS